MKNEEKYILKRKIKAFAESLVYYACRIFPIQKNKVVMWTFEGGGGFGCNPKYVAEEILKRNREGKSKLKIYWIMNDTTREFPAEIIKIKDSLLNRAYHFSTSKVWVSNTRTFLGTKKRKKQVYIQTWHGTIFIKPLGLYRGNKFSRIAEIVSRADSNLIDYVISNCKWCDDFYKSGLIYDGKIADIGIPRCDVLFNSRDEMRKKYREIYKLKEDAKILMYAPTFRGGSQKTDRGVTESEISLDFERLVKILKEKFNGEWFVFLRFHPQLSEKMKNVDFGETSKRIINVTEYPDVNELIAASDVFITDYSSAIFEAALIEIPCFIYADDLDDYISDRGDLMWDMNDLPFPFATDNTELIENISSFDSDLYKTNWNEFNKKVVFNESGNSSKNVVDLILNDV